MRILGIDLSGPRNFADTCLVSFEEHGGKNNEIKTGDPNRSPVFIIIRGCEGRDSSPSG